MRTPFTSAMVLIWASVSVADICSDLPGYSVNGTSCFKLYSISKTWADAEASCVADGGHLASIHSSQEQAFVANLVNRANSSDIWIGITAMLPNLTWSDNTTVDYEAWGFVDEPNEKGCGRLTSYYSYLWADRPCTMLFHYICRVNKVVDETQARFTKIPGGVPVHAAAVPSSTQTVRSVIECAQRCQQDAQCVHFIMSKDGDKYLCETYTTLKRPQMTAPPTDNYQKIAVVTP